MLLKQRRCSIKKEKYIDAVIGPQSYHKLNMIITKLECDSKKINSTQFDVIEKFDTLNSITNSESKVSSFLTIQEGCINFVNFVLFLIQEDLNFQDQLKNY